MSSEEDERRRRVEQERREQRERSDRGRESNDIGRWFHYGIAELRGETQANGWVHERPVKLPSGRERIHDNARAVNGHEFREYKGGARVGGDFVMEQISKEREFLQADPQARGIWIVQHGALEAQARTELEKLQSEFAGRFGVEEISRDLAHKAKKVGQSLERDHHQLELFDSAQLRSQQRAKEAREKARAKARVQEAAQRSLEKQAREQEAREIEQRRREAQRRERAAVQRVAEFSRQAREAAARGERIGMTGREVADIRALSFPNQLDPAKSQHHEHPEPGSTRASMAREPRNLHRGPERGR